MGTVHRRARDALIDQDRRLRDRIAFAFCEFLAGFDLCGDGEPFALVFSGHTGVDGGIPCMVSIVLCVFSRLLILHSYTPGTLVSPLAS